MREPLFNFFYCWVAGDDGDYLSQRKRKDGIASPANAGSQWRDGNSPRLFEEAPVSGMEKIKGAEEKNLGQILNFGHLDFEII